jgi:hypothetical protein
VNLWAAAAGTALRFRRTACELLFSSRHMFHPVPRADPWDPWIALTLLGLLVIAGIVVRLL